MAASTPIDPPAIQDNPSVPPNDAVPNVAPVSNVNNELGDQDVAMSGQEDAALRSAKSNDGPTMQPATTSATTSNHNNGNQTNGASSPAAATTPARTSTPTPARAPSAAPAAAMPAEAADNGAPTRVYINTKVTSHLLDGMKVLAKEKPADPLRVLGEFLLKRSAEVENGAASKEDQSMNGAD